MDAAIQLLIQSPAPLKKIGQGFCGTVWGDDESDDHRQDPRLSHLALKREDGGPGRSILLEYEIHQQLLECLEQAKADRLAEFRVNFPSCEGLLGRDSAHWPRILPRLPAGFEPCNALVNERIPTLPRSVRTFLSRTYHPSPTSPSATAAATVDDHCIIRPYLGRRRHRPDSAVSRTRPCRLAVFSLRNFPLHLDQIEELSLPADAYAMAMADALAFLYWKAKVDANDVEFVLAPTRLMSQAAHSNPGIGAVAFESETLGSHTMWVLDFDCCRNMEMNETGVQQAVRSFLRNDPFYPRPSSSHIAFDDALWDTLKSRFLEASHSILQEEDESMRDLPELLVKEITLACKQHRDTIDI